MSVFRNSGLVHKPHGVRFELTLVLKKVNLAPVQKLTFTVDPFHRNAEAVRNVMYHLSIPRIRDSNFKTIVKNNIVCDGSDPTIEAKLDNGKTLLFKCGLLTTLEILQHFNKHVLPLVPPPEDLSTSVSKTKSQRKK